MYRCVYVYYNKVLVQVVQPVQKVQHVAALYLVWYDIEGFRPEWCMSTVIYC